MYNIKKENLKLKLYKYRLRNMLKGNEKTVLEGNLSYIIGR